MISTRVARRLRVVAAVGLLAAILLEVVVAAAVSALPPEAPFLVAVSVVLDGLAVAGILFARSLRTRWLVVVYVVLRVLVASVAFFLPGVLAYGLAAVCLLWPRSVPRRGQAATSSHEYRSVADGWFGSLTPLRWSSELFGAAQLAQQRCVVCGGEPDDAIHAPVEPAR